MKILASLKIFRGSILDPFGYLPERRKERQLILNYQTLINEVIGNLSPESYDLAIELLKLPMQIRGFGHVKDKAIRKFELEERNILEKFRAISQHQAVE